MRGWSRFPTTGGVGAAIAGGFDTDTDTRFICGAATAAVVALGLLTARRRGPQVVAFVAALVLTALAIEARANLDDAGEGLVLVAVGAGLGAVAIAGWIPLPRLVLGLGGLVALVGVHLFAADEMGITIAPQHTSG